jgi:hypothetical protein
MTRQVIPVSDLGASVLATRRARHADTPPSIRGVYACAAAMFVLAVQMRYGNAQSATVLIPTLLFLGELVAFYAGEWAERQQNVCDGARGEAKIASHEKPLLARKAMELLQAQERLLDHTIGSIDLILYEVRSEQIDDMIHQLAGPVFREDLQERGVTPPSTLLQTPP